MGAQWQWQSDSEPWNVTDPKKISWTSYLPEENSLIEQAYHSSSIIPVLIQNKYMVDVQKFIQYRDISPTKQRRIRRLSNFQYMNDKNIRENRFVFPKDEEYHCQPFVKDIKFGSLMIQEWQKNFIHHHRGNMTFSEKAIVDAAIQGIEEESSRTIEFKEEAAKICDELRNVRDCGNKLDIKRCAVRLYTRNGFFYGLINRALREHDRRRYQNTLGPYCYLLYSYLCLRQRSDIDFYRGTVYRGARLHPGMINQFRKEMEKSKGLLTWLGFTSTTKSRLVADIFSSNTLFEILLGDEDYFTSQGVDISQLSMMPHEEEILLSPGFQFEIADVQTLEPTKEKPFPHYHIQLLPRSLHYEPPSEKKDDEQ